MGDDEEDALEGSSGSAEDDADDGNLSVTVSGPPEKVMAALSVMNFQQPVTPALCQQIALAATDNAAATVGDTLGGLDMLSPESRTAYTERCALHLKSQTGYTIDPSALPQAEDTMVQEVAGAMFDATT